ncbi:hypothetical protein [Streptomyces sp. NPDC058475]|uniref:hypothetical protein n=1 Tax=Streptomyces sp. NPDC058475 TaxID=3346518 RepID=UPI00364E80AE
MRYPDGGGLTGYPDGLRGGRRAAFAPEARELVLEVELPGQVVVPAVTQYRYKASAPPTVVPQPRKEAECKAMYRDLVARLALRAIAEAFAVSPPPLVDVVAFNGHVHAKDRATGKAIRPCLISLRASRGTFEDLVLDEPELDPVQSLHFLNAIVSQHPYDLEPVRPVVGALGSAPRGPGVSADWLACGLGAAHGCEGEGGDHGCEYGPGGVVPARSASRGAPCQQASTS